MNVEVVWCTEAFVFMVFPWDVLFLTFALWHHRWWKFLAWSYFAGSTCLQDEELQLSFFKLDASSCLHCLCCSQIIRDFWSYLRCKAILEKAETKMRYLKMKITWLLSVKMSVLVWFAFKWSSTTHHSWPHLSRLHSQDPRHKPTVWRCSAWRPCTGTGLVSRCFRLYSERRGCLKNAIWSFRRKLYLQKDLSDNTLYVAREKWGNQWCLSNISAVPFSVLHCNKVTLLIYFNISQHCFQLHFISVGKHSLQRYIQNHIQSNWKSKQG